MRPEDRRRKASVPGPGDVHATDIPDDFRGIRTEVEKMKEYVRQAPEDDLVLKTARTIALLCENDLPEDQKTSCIIAKIFEWAKKNVMYVHDPIDVEVIQTPGSMLREMFRPAKMLEAVLGPGLADAVRGRRQMVVTDRQFADLPSKVLKPACVLVDGKKVCGRATADCDEGAILLCSLLRSLGIECRFAFGAREKTASGKCQGHHVWAQALDPSSNNWIDMDITVPESTLGWRWPHFACTYTEDI